MRNGWKTPLHSNILSIRLPLELVKQKQKYKVRENLVQPEGIYKVFRQNMCTVLVMMMFTRVVQTAKWNLQSFKIITQSFFAHDSMNYVRLIPLHLAQMKSLKTTDPDIEAELQKGNWVVNKKGLVPFCLLS